MQTEMLDSTVSSNSQELSNASSAIKLFENPLFKARVIMRLGDPWFVAKDVATCIEHSDTSAMCKLCREKDKVVVRANDLTSDDLSDVKNREYTLISESGLYRILAKCNLPKCEPWFVAKDVCDCLELGNPSQAIARLEDDERWLISNEALRANGETAVVSEPGLYSLVLGSREPEAKAFKRWVTHEVLPSIRKTGGSADHIWA